MKFAIPRIVTYIHTHFIATLRYGFSVAELHKFMSEAHLPYKPYETTFARIFLILETVGLLDSRHYVPYSAIYYNTTQHNTTQHNTIHYNALCNMLFWEFKLAWGEDCSKNRKIRAKVDSWMYGRWRLRVMGSCSCINNKKLIKLFTITKLRNYERIHNLFIFSRSYVHNVGSTLLF